MENYSHIHIREEGAMTDGIYYGIGNRTGISWLECSCTPHRLDGPAVEYKSIKEPRYYIQGMNMSKHEHDLSSQPYINIAIMKEELNKD